MTKRSLISLCAFLICTNLRLMAGNITKWSDSPTLHHVPDQYKDEAAILLEENTRIEYRDEPNNEVWIYRTTHRTVKLISSAGIDFFNKMSFEYHPGQVPVQIRARAILPDNTVKEIDSSQIKSISENDGTIHVFFAMDGLVENAEVELINEWKKPVTVFGSEAYQFGIPTVHATFELISPKRLKFEARGYNGFPSGKDTVIADDRVIFIEAKNIPGISNEPYSYPEAVAQRVDFKLSYLMEKNPTVRVNTWQDFIQRLHENLYSFSEKDEKAIKKFLIAAGVTVNDDEQVKICKIESAIKNQISIDNRVSETDGSEVQEVLSRRTGSKNGIIKVFCGCFSSLGINHELGISESREIGNLDVDFENWMLPNEYLFYFPLQKQFMSPLTYNIRYPFTQADVLDNQGLFCKSVSVGGANSILGTFRKIIHQPYTKSENCIDALITIGKDFSCHSDQSFSFSGYCAASVREAMTAIPEDKQKDLVLKINMVTEDPDKLESYTVRGQNFDNYYLDSPMVIKIGMNVSYLIEKAGTKYLFKIGELIGKQEELYSDKKRKLPADMIYPHNLARTLRLKMPDGFKVSNPDVLKLDVEFHDAAQRTTAAFKSNYEYSADQLIVRISEYYDQLHYPIEQFDAFRRVINSSADFNKISILLEPK